jgi:hypothetical protein
MDTSGRIELQDVIAHAWYSLGYRPTNSLVFVAIDRVIERSGLVLRVDLPPPAQPPEAVHDLAHRIAQRLRGAGARAAVLLVVSDRVLQAPPSRLVRAISAVLAQRSVALRGVIGVTRRAFRSLTCRDPRCCPRSGRSIDLVLTSEVAMTRILAGDRFPEDCSSRSSSLLTAAVRDRWWQIWTEALAAGRLHQYHRPGFALALADKQLADRVMTSAIGSHPIGTSPYARGTAAASPILAPGWTGPPWGRNSAADRFERLARAEQVVQAAARHGPPGHRADALAVLAVITWYGGRRDLARHHAEAALLDRPHHSLAGTLLGLLLLGAPPPWARPPDVGTVTSLTVRPDAEMRCPGP